MGLCWFKRVGATKVTIVKDSSIIIRHMKYNTSTKDHILNQFLSQSHLLSSHFEDIRYLQVLGNLNFLVDQKENDGTGLKQGDLKMGISSLVHSPFPNLIVTKFTAMKTTQTPLETRHIEHHHFQDLFSSLHDLFLVRLRKAT